MPVVVFCICYWSQHESKHETLGSSVVKTQRKKEKEIKRGKKKMKEKHKRKSCLKLLKEDKWFSNLGLCVYLSLSLCLSVSLSPCLCLCFSVCCLSPYMTRCFGARQTVRPQCVDSTIASAFTNRSILILKFLSFSSIRIIYCVQQFSPCRLVTEVRYLFGEQSPPFIPITETTKQGKLSKE